MGQLENTMLLVLGFLMICLIGSVLFKPSENKPGIMGYKCNEGKCEQVNYAPNNNGVYSDLQDCNKKCSTPTRLSDLNE